MTCRKIVVYTQPGCSSCHSAERFLAAKGIAFEVRDISRDATALKEFLQFGFLRTPVTVIGGKAYAASHGQRWSERWRSSSEGWWPIVLGLLVVLLTTACRPVQPGGAHGHEMPVADTAYTLIVRPEAHGPGTVHLDSPSFR